MIDLLAVLKALLKEDTLSLHSGLAAVLTGLRALRGPGRELMVDEKDFVNILYKLLPRLIHNRKNRSCLPIALECVHEMFLKNKEIIVDRVAAFVKRLLLISTTLPPHQVLAIMSLVRSLFHKYAKLHPLVECEAEHIASGVYRADVDDPDFSNPYASSCWELGLLRLHWHPKVSSFALGTSTLAPSLPTEHPMAFLEAYNVDVNAKFVPPLRMPKPNGLHAKSKKRSIYIYDSCVPTSFLKSVQTRAECLKQENEDGSRLNFIPHNMSQ